MSSLRTDPNAESPDVIDERDPTDPSHLDPRPGEPSVTPGITLPTVIPPGWTLAADGSMVPLEDAPPTPVTTLPNMTIAASPPSSSTGAIIGIVIAVTAFVGFLWAKGGR